MRVRTRSACVVLAWGILLILAAAGFKEAYRPAQANTRTAGSTTTSITSTTSSTTTRTIQVTLTSTLISSPAGRPDTAAAPAAARPALRGPRTDTDTPTDTDRQRAGTGTRTDPDTYVVQPGNTLSGIAVALGIRGGWPTLYAANWAAIGPDPNVIHTGTALALPGPATPARYVVAAGDTLSGIATALGTRGGWLALYTANRQAIGPDPNVIHTGTVLTIPRPAPSASPTPRPSPPPTTAPAPTQPPAAAQPPTTAQPTRPPAPAKAPATAGLPRWLEIVLLAAGLLIGTAFLTESALAIARRHRQAARPDTGPAACPSAQDPRILLADYDRLVVTSSGPDGTVCVLRPPGADPEVILLAARLVLAQDRYEELAGHLGVAPRRQRE